MSTLSDVAQIVDCEHKTAPIDESGGYFAVGTPAMRNNAIDFSEARRINKVTFTEWTRRLMPKAGDLLFAREAPVGPVVRIPVDENVAPGQRTVLIRPETCKIDSDFLFYLLISPRMQARVQSLSEGSTVAHLNVADVRSLVLGELPPLSLQRAIGEVLGALDDKIAANVEVAENSLSLGESLVRAAPVERVRLGEAASVTMGTSPKGEELNERGEGQPFFQGVRDFGRVFPATRVYTTDSIRIAPAGSVLFAVRAPVGSVNFAPEAVSIGRGLASITGAAGSATLYFALRGSSEIWDEFQGNGTVFASVNGADVRSAWISMPKPEFADKVEQQLSGILGLAVQVEKESQRLAATRDELLPLLMSGKITVKDAEKTVEEVV